MYEKIKSHEELVSKTTFINPDIERLEKELSLLTEQKMAIDRANREKQKAEGKQEYVMVNGDKYIVKGSKMEKVVSIPLPEQKKKKKEVCLMFCKYGSCSTPSCPCIHDKSIVRICPSFLKVGGWGEMVSFVGLLPK